MGLHSCSYYPCIFWKQNFSLNVFETIWPFKAPAHGRPSLADIQVKKMSRFQVSKGQKLLLLKFFFPAAMGSVCPSTRWSNLSCNHLYGLCLVRSSFLWLWRTHGKWPGWPSLVCYTEQRGATMRRKSGQSESRTYDSGSSAILSNFTFCSVIEKLPPPPRPHRGRIQNFVGGLSWPWMILFCQCVWVITCLDDGQLNRNRIELKVRLLVRFWGGDPWSGWRQESEKRVWDCTAL